MSSFSANPQYAEVIISFIDSKINQVEDKLFIQPKQDDEEDKKKVIVEQLLHDKFNGPTKMVNPKLSGEEVTKLQSEISFLETLKTIPSEEAFNQLVQYYKSFIEKLNSEHTVLIEKSNVKHRQASANELKLKTLKSEYNKKLSMVYDDDAKGSNDNKISKRLPLMKEEIDKLSKEVVIERRDAVHLRENEITSRKNIERIQKEIDNFREKIKKLQQQNEKPDDVVQPQEVPGMMLAPMPPMENECWSCEGPCTCNT